MLTMIENLCARRHWTGTQGREHRCRSAHPQASAAEARTVIGAVRNEAFRALAAPLAAVVRRTPGWREGLLSRPVTRPPRSPL
jgi:hypothetical protein